MTKIERIGCYPSASYMVEVPLPELEPVVTDADAARNITRLEFGILAERHRRKRLVEYVKEECQP